LKNLSPEIFGQVLGIARFRTRKSNWTGGRSSQMMKFLHLFHKEVGFGNMEGYDDIKDIVRRVLDRIICLYTYLSIDWFVMTKHESAIMITAIALFATLMTSFPVTARIGRPLTPVSVAGVNRLIVDKATLLFGVNLPSGQESPTFIQNVTQLAKEGFDSPENVKLFLQLDSIALNATKAHPGNVTLTAPTISHIISVYNQMKRNNSTGGFTEIATVAMQALNPVSGFDAGGRNVTALPNSLDFGDILKFGSLAAGFGCATGPNSGDFAHIVGWNSKAGPCIGSALGAAVVRLIWKN
jgi:hypothetical protein